MAEDTLAEYLKAQPWKGGASCAVCSLPPEVRGQIDDAIRLGLKRWRGMVRWLDAKGIEGITAAMLQYHNDRGHADER